MKIFSIQDATEWNSLIQGLPGAHILQTWEWGQLKAQFGWQPHPLVWRNQQDQVCAGALVLLRKVTFAGGLFHSRVMYAPRGPLLNWSNVELAQQVLDDLQTFTRQQGAIFLKIDPDLPLGFGVPEEPNTLDDSVGQDIQQSLQTRGWRFSEEQIQFKNTVTIDLTDDEEALLMQMKSKTRYNIRLAERRGVTVRVGGIEDIDLLYRMYAHTSIRDNFLIRGKDYYAVVWRIFFEAGLAKPLIAEVDGEAVGAVIIFQFAGRAWYLYGMSLDEYRETMFNYRLQWEAMVQSKAAGCSAYDMWGAPDEFTEDDPLWGVYRFKVGFGGQVVRTLGAWDFPARPILYRLYQNILPRLLSLMRNRGKMETKRRMAS